jgi:hypothetical protein
MSFFSGRPHARLMPVWEIPLVSSARVVIAEAHPSYGHGLAKLLTASGLVVVGAVVLRKIREPSQAGGTPSAPAQPRLEPAPRRAALHRGRRLTGVQPIERKMWQPTLAADNLR